jgi:hypothetical protein
VVDSSESVNERNPQTTVMLELLNFERVDDVSEVARNHLTTVTSTCRADGLRGSDV